MKNQIKSVRIEQVYDESPDTDFIGKYTDKDDNWNICCHCGEYVIDAEKGNRREEEITEELDTLEDETNCEYDTPETKAKIVAFNKELESLDLHECPRSTRNYNFFKPYAGGEKEGTEEYQKYGKQDFERMEGLNNGDWNFIGIIAKVEVLTSNGVLQTIRSGGLWGIESDAGDYLDEVGKEELANLRSELMALGFGKRAIDYAFKNVETIDK